MLMFLFNKNSMFDYKEWVRHLKYNAKSDSYYIENFSMDADRIVIHIMTIRDRAGIYLLCKLLARFRSLRHQR